MAHKVNAFTFYIIAYLADTFIHSDVHFWESMVSQSLEQFGLKGLTQGPNDGIQLGAGGGTEYKPAARETTFKLNFMNVLMDEASSLKNIPIHFLFPVSCGHYNDRMKDKSDVSPSRFSSKFPSKLLCSFTPGSVCIKGIFSAQFNLFWHATPHIVVALQRQMQQKNNKCTW